MTVSHLAFALRLALLVVVPILGLIVNQPCIAQESSNSATKAVVICVHGVMSNGNNDTYGKLKEIRGFTDEASTLVVDFHWGSEWFFYASQGIGHRADQFSGISRYQWCTVAKLKNLVASLRRNGTIDASTKVSVLSHSQGTVVTLCALAEGMHLDNWVLMGSPLSEKVIRDKSNHTEFLKAAANVKGTIVNLNSPADDPAGLWNHIGRRGLPFGLTGKTPTVLVSVSTDKDDRPTPNQLVRVWSLGRTKHAAFDPGFHGIVDVPLRGIDHAGKEGELFGAGWWSLFWARPEYALHWPDTASWSDVQSLLVCNDSTTSFGEQQREVSEKLAAIPINRDWNILDDESAENPGADAPWGGFGWAARGREFVRTFTVTKGMETGFHFDDASSVSYEIKCLHGTVSHELKVATWFDWDKTSAPAGTPGLLSAGRTHRDKWTAKGITDKTIYLKVVGTSKTPAVVQCTITASPIKPDSKPAHDGHFSAENTLQLDSELQIAREPLSTKRERDAAQLLGAGLSESVKSGGKHGPETAFLRQPTRHGVLERGSRSSGPEEPPKFRLVSLLSNEADKADDFLLSALEFIQPIDADKEEYARKAATYRDLLDAQKKEIKDFLEAQKKEKSDKGKSIKLHAGLLELLRTKNLLERELAGLSERIADPKLSTDQAAELVRLAPEKALSAIAKDRANARRLRAWMRNPPNIRTHLISSSASNADLQSLERLLLRNDVPDSFKARQQDDSSRKPREESDEADYLAVGDEDAESIWLRKHRETLNRGLDVITATIHRKARAKSPIAAINRFVDAGKSFTIPHGAKAAGRPHFEFNVTNTERTDSDSLSLHCELFLCLPNTLVKSIQRVHGDVEADGKANEFERIQLGLELSDLRIRAEALEPLGQIVWAQHQTQLKIKKLTQAARIAEVQLPTKGMSLSAALPDVDGIVASVLSKSLFFAPASNRASARWTDRNAPLELLRRLGMPSSLASGVKFFRIDRERLQWIEFVVQIDVPFDTTSIDVPLRLDLSNGQLDEAALTAAIRKQIAQECIQRFNQTAKNKTAQFGLTNNLHFDATDFRFSFSGDSLEPDVTFDASLTRVKSSDRREPEETLGKWQFRMKMSSRQSQSGLASFALPGTHYRLSLDSAEMIGGRFGVQSFVSIDKVKRIVATEKPSSKEQPSSEDAGSILDWVLGDLASLEVTTASLSQANGTIQLAATVTSPAGRLESSQIVVRGDQFETDLAKLVERFAKLSAKRALLDWLAKNTGSASEQLIAKLAKKLPGTQLNAGLVSIKFGSCKVEEYGKANDIKAIKITQLEMGLPEGIAKEPVIVKDVWFVLGSGDSNASEIDFDDLKQSLATLLKDQAHCKLDWSDSQIQSSKSWPDKNTDIEIAGIKVKLQVPELVVTSEDGKANEIGLAIVATLESGILPAQLPRLRFVVLPGSQAQFMQKERGRTNSVKWETIDNAKQLIWSAAMAELSDAASENLYGVKIDLLGLGEWTFNRESEKPLPCQFMEADGGGLKIEINGSFDIAGRKAFATVDLASGAVKWKEGQSISNLFSELLAEEAGLPIRILNPAEIRSKKEIGWSVDIVVALGEGMGEFRANGVRITTRGIKMPISLCWTSPTPFAFGPVVWLTKPSITIPLNGTRKIGAAGNLTFPYADMDKIIKVRCSLTIELEDEGLRANAVGTTVFFIMFPVYENRGELLIGNNRLFCELSAETVGVMKAIMTNNQYLTIDTGVGTLSAEGEFGLFGVSLADASLIYGQKNENMPQSPDSDEPPAALRIEAKFVLLGSHSDLLVKIREGFTSYDGYATTSLGKVLGVQVGEVKMEIQEDYSRVKFNALGASLDVVGPGPSNLNGSWIEKQIRKLIQDALKDLLAPEKLIQAAEQILSGNVQIEIGGKLGGKPGKPGGGPSSPSTSSSSDGKNGNGDKEGGDKNGNPGDNSTETHSGNVKTDGVDGDVPGQRDHVPDPNRKPRKPSGKRKKLEYVKPSGGPFEDIWEEKRCFIKIDRGNRVEIRHTQDVYSGNPEDRPYYRYLPTDIAEHFNSPPLFSSWRTLVMAPVDSTTNALDVFRLGYFRVGQKESKGPDAARIPISKADADLDDDGIGGARAALGFKSSFADELKAAAEAKTSRWDLATFSEYERSHVWSKVWATTPSYERWRNDDIRGYTKLAKSGGNRILYLVHHKYSSKQPREELSIRERTTGNSIGTIKQVELPDLFKALSGNVNDFKAFAALVDQLHDDPQKQLNLYGIRKDAKDLSRFVFAVTDSRVPDRLELRTIAESGRTGSRLVLHEKGVAVPFSRLQLRKVPKSMRSDALMEEFKASSQSAEIDCFRQDGESKDGRRTFITVRNLSKKWTIRVSVEGLDKTFGDFTDGTVLEKRYKEWKSEERDLVKSKQFTYKNLSSTDARTSLVKILLESRDGDKYRTFFKVNPLGLLRPDAKK